MKGFYFTAASGLLPYIKDSLLTFSKGNYVIRLFGRRTRAQFVDGNQPETVHGEGQ